jgi:hypothetical protein
VSRARLLLALSLLVPAGLLTKASGAPLIRGYLGGALYVMFFTYVVLLARPRARPAAVALGVLLATCAVEAFQLCRWPEGLRATFLGGVILGSEFDPLDFPCYAVGAMLALAGARALYTGSTKVVAKSTPGSSASTTSSQ